MNNHKSIALLTCYFGQLPWYFRYFVHSCRYNPDVDFIIITDDSTCQLSLPVNVKIIYQKLEDINALATRKLGFETQITYGYKLCDFKPAYGFIFDELLGEHDFWGHCDIDIIFGNIRNFITNQLLEDYELISVRHDWLSGCFLLYRNNEKLNKLFMQSNDYKKVLGNNQHYCFDETNFAHDAFNEGKLYHEVPTEIDSMTHVVMRKQAEGYLNPFFDFYIIEGRPGKLRWETGTMYYRNKYEVLFYHLIKLKALYTPARSNAPVPDNFSISPTRIYRKRNLKLPLFNAREIYEQ